MFGDTPGFVFNLGGGGGPTGIRVTNMGGGRPRRRPAQNAGPEPPQSISSTLSALLPLLFLFVLPLLSSLFSGGSSQQTPSMSFDSPRGTFTKARTSHRFKAPYWVNPKDLSGYSERDLRRLDEAADSKYIHIVNVRCENERMQQNRMVQDATGWFFQDQDRLRQAAKMPMPNCQKLKDLGVSW